MSSAFFDWAEHLNRAVALNKKLKALAFSWAAVMLVVASSYAVFVGEALGGTNISKPVPGDQYGPRAISSVFTSGYCPNIPTSFNAVKVVSSEAEFIAAYGSLKPGEAIVVRDGSYDWDLVKILSRSGASNEPLFILAESYRGVIFTRSSGTFQFDGAFHVVAGFQWQNQNAPAVSVSADNNTIACNYFAGANTGSYIGVGSGGLGDYTEIRDNVFDGHNVSCSRSGGWAVVLKGSMGLVETQFVHIHNNKWTNEPACGTNGHEALIVGLGLQNPPVYAPSAPDYDSPNDMKAIIENNLFDGWNGEDELISIKSDRNVIRNNCIINTPGAGISIRQGSGNQIYGNWMVGMGRGIRDGGWRNFIVFNLFHGRGANAFIRVHQDVASYLDPDHSLYRYNVVSNTGYWMEQFINGTPDSEPERMTVHTNVMYSDQYVADWKPITHTWRQWQSFTGNVFINNTVNLTDLAPREVAQGCGEATLFNGPGVAVVPDPTHLSQDLIMAPDWWGQAR